MESWVNDAWNRFLDGTQIADYIRGERNRLAPLGQGLNPLVKDELQQWFAADLLNSVVVVLDEPVREPPFALQLQIHGIVLPTFAIAEAVTLSDVIAARFALSRSTLLHELVHVVQYRLLGIDQFGRRYLEEYLRSGYEAMPLEVIAVELANRLEAGEVFDVLGAVAERL
jgi:hypothetical protein